MALTPFNDNIQIDAPKSLDAKYTKFFGGLGVPFTNLAEANASTIPEYRSIGLTKLIMDGALPREYWYRDGIADSDLIPKGDLFTLNIQDTSTLFLNGTGTALSPLYGDVQVSQQPNNSIQILPDGLYLAQTIKSGVVYGGLVTWLSGYSYNVSAAGYYINGVFYTSPSTNFTLATPDTTNNRIDTFVVNTSGQAIVLQGTPSSNPAQAPMDTATQLQLSFALVETGTTQPSSLQVECVYKENTEWLTHASTVRINPSSTNTPCSGTKSVEGTSVVDGDNVKFTRSSAFDPSTNFTILKFVIKSKNNWNASHKKRKLSLQFRLGNTNVGTPIILQSGNYGFDSTDTIDCQLVSLLLSDFGISGTVDNLFISAQVQSSSIGFWIDDICFQGMPVPPQPAGFNLYTQDTPTINLSATGSGTSTTPLMADLIVGAVDNTQTNILVWDGTNIKLRDASTLGGGGGASITADNGLNMSTLTNVQLGGTLLHDTSIDATSAYTLNITGGRTSGFKTLYVENTSTGDSIVTHSSSGIACSAYSQNNAAFLGIAANGVGGVFSSYSTHGVQGTTSAGVAAARFSTSDSGTNTFLPVINITRSSPNADIGFGGYIQFQASIPSWNVEQGRIGYKWTNVVHSSEAATFEIWNKNIGITERKLAISANGMLTLDNYNAAITAGTLAFGLGVDTNGNVITTTIGGGSGTYSVNNGLTENVSGNFQLGGTLAHNTTINQGAYIFNFVSNQNTSAFTSDNSGGGYAITGSATTGIGVYGYATSGAGVYAQSSTGRPLDTIVNPTSIDDVVPSARFTRTSQLSPLAGYGTSLELFLKDDTNNERVSNTIISKWTDPTIGNQTSQFIITGKYFDSELDILTLNGDGSLKANNYGIGTFTGTPVYTLQVDAAGNIIEGALSGGGGGGTTYTVDNGLTENPASNFQLGGALTQATSIDFSAAPLTITGSYTGSPNQHGYIKFLSGALDTLYDGGVSNRFSFRQGVGLLFDVFADDGSSKTLFSIEKDYTLLNTDYFWVNSATSTQAAFFAVQKNGHISAHCTDTSGRVNDVTVDYNAVNMYSSHGDVNASMTCYADDYLDKWNATVYNQATTARTHIRMSNGDAGGIILEDFVAGQATNRITVNNAGVLIDAGQTNAIVSITSSKIKMANIPSYANDAAADADTALASGSLYKITGNRAVYQKP